MTSCWSVLVLGFIYNLLPIKPLPYLCHLINFTLVSIYVYRNTCMYYYVINAYIKMQTTSKKIFFLKRIFLMPFTYVGETECYLCKRINQHIPRWFKKWDLSIFLEKPPDIAITKYSLQGIQEVENRFLKSFVKEIIII